MNCGCCGCPWGAAGAAGLAGVCANATEPAVINKTAAAAGESIRRTGRAGPIELKPIINNLFVAAAALERVS